MAESLGITEFLRRREARTECVPAQRTSGDTGRDSPAELEEARQQKRGNQVGAVEGGAVPSFGALTAAHGAVLWGGAVRACPLPPRLSSLGVLFADCGRGAGLGEEDQERPSAPGHH